MHVGSRPTALLVFLPTAARAEVVATELLDEFLVAVDCFVAMTGHGEQGRLGNRTNHVPARTRTYPRPG